MRVYEEYKQFYRNKLRKPHNYDQDLKLKKDEIVTKPKLFSEDDDPYGEEEIISQSNPESSGFSKQITDQFKSSLNLAMDNNGMKAA